MLACCTLDAAVCDLCLIAALAKQNGVRHLSWCMLSLTLHGLCRMPLATLYTVCCVSRLMPHVTFRASCRALSCTPCSTMRGACHEPCYIPRCTCGMLVCCMPYTLESRGMVRDCSRSQQMECGCSPRAMLLNRTTHSNFSVELNRIPPTMHDRTLRGSSSRTILRAMSVVFCTLAVMALTPSTATPRYPSHVVGPS